MLLTVLFDTAELQNIKEQLSKPQNTAAYSVSSRAMLLIDHQVIKGQLSLDHDSSLQYSSDRCLW